MCSRCMDQQRSGRLCVCQCALGLCGLHPEMESDTESECMGHTSKPPIKAVYNADPHHSALGSHLLPPQVGIPVQGFKTENAADAAHTPGMQSARAGRSILKTGDAHSALQSTSSGDDEDDEPVLTTARAVKFVDATNAAFAGSLGSQSARRFATQKNSCCPHGESSGSGSSRNRGAADLIVESQGDARTDRVRVREQRAESRSTSRSPPPRAKEQQPGGQAHTLHAAMPSAQRLPSTTTCAGAMASSHSSSSADKRRSSVERPANVPMLTCPNSGSNGANRSSTGSVPKAAEDPMHILIREIRSMRKEIEANTKAIKTQAEAVQHLAMLMSRVTHDVNRLSLTKGVDA
jgi:hypothetical protein